jgi:hypothetical protein
MFPMGRLNICEALRVRKSDVILPDVDGILKLTSFMMAGILFVPPRTDATE